jgi:hypothetical protein
MLKYDQEIALDRILTLLYKQNCILRKTFLFNNRIVDDTMDSLINIVLPQENSFL